MSKDNKSVDELLRLAALAESDAHLLSAYGDKHGAYAMRQMASSYIEDALASEAASCKS